MRKYTNMFFSFSSGATAYEGCISSLWGNTSLCTALSLYQIAGRYDMEGAWCICIKLGNVFS